MILPRQLQQAIESEFHEISLRKISENAHQLQERYRTGAAAAHTPHIQSTEDSLAYAAYRLPATFAAVHSALAQVKERLPEWQPKTLLDIGSGPGTAAWAAIAVWPALERITLLEKDQRMIDLGKRLLSSSDVDVLRRAHFRRVDLGASWNPEPHDLAIASYVLGELAEPKRDAITDQLCATAAVIVILEPAKSSRGFAVVLRARQRLIDRAASIVAPCPHERACPKSAGDGWCHFAQRVERTKLHRSIKTGFRPYEDEKFSYVAASKLHASPIRGRVTLQPHLVAGTIRLELCAPAGLEQIAASKRDKASFQIARKLRWGDAVPADANLGPPHSVKPV